MSLDLLVWRSMLARAAADVPGIDHQLRAAEACDARGLTSAARMLRQILRLQQGFSPQVIARRDDETVWDSAAAGFASTVEIAIAETRAIAGMVAREMRIRPPIRRDDVPELGDLADLVDALFRFVAQDGCDMDGGNADGLLDRLAETIHCAAAFDYRDFAAAPLVELAAAIGLAGVRDFVLANHDLLFPPVGSAKLLHHAARLDQAGLGPYLTNVPRIAGRSRDIFELAEIGRRATLTGVGEEVSAARWIVVLTQHVTGALRDEVVDDLADLDARDTLAAILEREARKPDGRVSAVFVARLRDAALDNGDYDLAIRSQALIVRLRPDDLLERRLLGSIEATAGRFAAAERSFLVCLRSAPGDVATVERLAALRDGRFQAFAVEHGFGSPIGRRLTRSRRRQPMRTDARPERPRPPAVDL